jgi:hypothetical protein
LEDLAVSIIRVEGNGGGEFLQNHPERRQIFTNPIFTTRGHISEYRYLFSACLRTSHILTSLKRVIFY